MRLSTNFTLAELCKSEIALRHGIDNTPTVEAVKNLAALAINVLQPIRDHYRKPISPRGYRNLQVNRLAGSQDTSQHIRGEAADFEVPGIANATVAKWIDKNLQFDQLILEFYEKEDPNSGWIHVSYSLKRNRNQVLTINRHGRFAGLVI